MIEVNIAGKNCQIIEKGKPNKVIYLANEDSLQLENYLSDCNDYLLVCYGVEDWNRDFSPWPYRMNKYFDFKGEGKKTLEWLVNDCQKYVRNNYGEIDNQYVCGYSLAGMFSLWVFYECEAFNGVGSFSGSLWFEGWHDYIETKKKHGLMYLSLGNRESNTRNQVMARVYDETVHQYEIASKSCKCIFELNEGGHFDNVNERIARGVKWLIVNDIDNVL